MKSWPKSLILQGETIGQKHIMRWISENIERSKTLSVAYIDPNHIRLTDIYNNHYLIAYNSDGSVTMREIQYAC